MKRFYIIVLLLSALTSSSLLAQGINQKDAQGLRHGTWSKTYEGTKQLRYTGTFNHGKEEGVFKFYDKRGGKPMAIKKYIPGQNFIEVKFYKNTGSKISEGKMIERSKEGEWLYYHSNGESIMTRELYRNNKLEGTRTVYFLNGKKAQETMYAKGLKEGKEIHYNEEGITTKEYLYVNDILEGHTKLYNADGVIFREGRYKANRKHGSWKYYENGKLDTIIKFPQNKIGI